MSIRRSITELQTAQAISKCFGDFGAPQKNPSTNHHQLQRNTGQVWKQTHDSHNPEVRETSVRILQQASKDKHGPHLELGGKTTPSPAGLPKIDPLAAFTVYKQLSTVKLSPALGKVTYGLTSFRQEAGT